jgi:hypothetical protein
MPLCADIQVEPCHYNDRKAGSVATGPATRRRRTQLLRTRHQRHHHSRPATEDDLADALDAIIKGEADRQTAEGAAFVAMSNPSAAQVAAVRTAFTTARNPKNLALEKTDREREEASVMLPEALDRCKDIYDTVEFFYRKDPDDSSRRPVNLHGRLVAAQRTTHKTATS